MPQFVTIGVATNLSEDYYNGENLATCYSFRSQIQLDKDEALFDRMSAYKVRQSIIKVLTQEMGLASFWRAHRS